MVALVQTNHKSVMAITVHNHNEWHERVGATSMDEVVKMTDTITHCSFG